MKKPIGISILTEKGGVGKTTTTFNLGCALAKKGYAVLLVDLDKQRNLSMACDSEKNRETKAKSVVDMVYTYLSMGSIGNANDYIQHDPTNNLDYIESNKMLDAVNGFFDQITDKDERNHVFKKIFSSTEFEQYDYILFDSKTAIDILIQNSLCFAAFAIIPVEVDTYSLMGLAEVIKKIQNNQNIRIMGILMNKVNMISNIERNLFDSFEQKYEGLLFETKIPEKKKHAKEPVLMKTGCVNMQGNKLAEYYMALADEVIERSNV